MTLRLGAHVPFGGGYARAIERVAKMGGNVLQLFASNPHEWGHIPIPRDEIARFRAHAEKLGIHDIYFHAAYLTNLADPGRVGKASKTTLMRELAVAAEMGVKGSIVHVGSWKGERADWEGLAKTIRDIIEATPKGTLFIAENSGVRKIGVALRDLGELARRVGHERFRVCLDTCHLFTAGYDLGSEEKLEKFLMEFEREVGMEHLEVWHLNDSRDPFHSYRDRHENIGEGHLGLEPFRLLLTHSKMRHYPFIIETPGFGEDGGNRKNLDILKGLVK